MIDIFDIAYSDLTECHYFVVDGEKYDITEYVNNTYEEGYQQGREDAIEEFVNALTTDMCECCCIFRDECTKGNECFIHGIAEQMKEEKDERGVLGLGRTARG